MPHETDETKTGREAPMVITLRDLVRLARQLADAARSVVRAARRRSDHERPPM
jgi:hypothetical protein